MPKILDIQIVKTVQVKGRGTVVVTHDNAEVGDFILHAKPGEGHAWYRVVDIDAFLDDVSGGVRKPIGLVLRKLREEEVVSNCRACESPIPTDPEIHYCDSACQEADEAISAAEYYRELCEEDE